VTSVRVDEQDHVWVLCRPRSVPEAQRAQAAPPVLEFDTDGNFLRGWGGPGAGYDWPTNEHGFTDDPNGFIWIAGNNPNFGGSRPNATFDDMLLKFSKDGKFVLQIGGRDTCSGNKDTKNVHSPADCAFSQKTHEIFVADGYGNRRVAVFDGNTGTFRRMWGAFGKPPVDRDTGRTPGQPGEADYPSYGAPGDFDIGEGPEHFGIVHAIRISKDGQVYVGDRDNRRVQVFTLDGKYLKQVFINPWAGPSRTACGITFSPDAQERFMYVCDFDHGRIFIYDRKTLAALGSFGTQVPKERRKETLAKSIGAFVDPHFSATDSTGSLYVAETAGGQRVQKFTFKGIA
jgi:hypothetical protein